jgi:hypothetical protein
MHTAKINFDRPRGAFGTINYPLWRLKIKVGHAKTQSTFFLILQLTSVSLSQMLVQ